MKSYKVINIILVICFVVLMSCGCSKDMRTPVQAAEEIYLLEFNGDQPIPKDSYGTEEQIRKELKRHASNLHATYGEYTGEKEVRASKISANDSVAFVKILFKHEKVNNPETFWLERNDSIGYWERSRKHWKLNNDSTFETYTPW